MSRSLKSDRGKIWGTIPKQATPRLVTSALQERGEVSVCNMVFTRQRGFLSRLPSRLWGNQELCFQGGMGQRKAWRISGDSSNIPRVCLAMLTLEVKEDVELKFLNWEKIKYY